MTTFTFDTNIPAANNAPRNDQPGMQINNASTSGLINVDHIGFNVPNGGYHTIIHQPNQIVGGQTAWNPVAGSGVPAAVSATAIPGIQQTFSMLYTPDTTGGSADTQLFSMTGNGGVSQLTGNTATNDGWVWSGGILIQWGIVVFPCPAFSTRCTASITFKDRSVGCIPFPNNCFIVIGTPITSTTADPEQSSLSIRAKNATGFTYLFNTTASLVVYTGFYWVAIGN